MTIALQDLATPSGFSRTAVHSPQPVREGEAGTDGAAPPGRCPVPVPQADGGELGLACLEFERPVHLVARVRRSVACAYTSDEAKSGSVTRCSVKRVHA
jgi:hypothetical protein